MYMHPALAFNARYKPVFYGASVLFHTLTTKQSHYTLCSVFCIENKAIFRTITATKPQAEHMISAIMFSYSSKMQFRLFACSRQL
jgi:hypothetical protein